MQDAVSGTCITSAVVTLLPDDPQVGVAAPLSDWLRCSLLRFKEYKEYSPGDCCAGCLCSSLSHKKLLVWFCLPVSPSQEVVSRLSTLSWWIVCTSPCPATVPFNTSPYIRQLAGPAGFEIRDKVMNRNQAEFAGLHC